MKYVPILLALLSFSALAQSVDEKQAYCQHVMDDGDAEKTLDQGIVAYGRLGQSDTNPTLKQAVVGVSKSLSKHLQGNSAARAAELECMLYSKSLDVQLVVQYKLIDIDKKVATAQVAELENVLATIDDEIAAAEKRKNVGNATVADIMTLTQQRLQIYGQYIAAKLMRTTPEIPKVPQLKVVEAMADVDQATFDLQEELNHKQELQAWDISLIGGVQQPITGIPSGTSSQATPFVSLTFTYNFNAGEYHKKLQTSAASLMSMRKVQNSELNHQVDVLQKSISDTLTMEQNLLPELIQQTHKLEADLSAVKNIDSPEARRMKAQIRVSLAIAKMEENLTSLKIELLSQ